MDGSDISSRAADFIEPALGALRPKSAPAMAKNCTSNLDIAEAVFLVDYSRKDESLGEYDGFFKCRNRSRFLTFLHV